MLPEPLSRDLADAGARLRIGYPLWLRPVLMRDVIGITLGRRIYVMAGLEGEVLHRLVRHELVHVRQIDLLGLARFLWRYLCEYIRHRRSGLGSSAAYARVSFEIEARAAEDV